MLDDGREEGRTWRRRKKKCVAEGGRRKSCFAAFDSRGSMPRFASDRHHPPSRRLFFFLCLQAWHCNLRSKVFGGSIIEHAENIKTTSTEQASSSSQHGGVEEKWWCFVFEKAYNLAREVL